MKFSFCIFISVNFLLSPMISFAQYPNLPEDNVYAIAKQDAIADAELHTNDLQWVGCGFFGSFLGVGAAYIVESKPPQERLLGKPSSYLFVYNMIYKRTVRSLRLKHALIGCGVSSVLASCIGTAILIHHCAEDDPCYPFFYF